MGNVETRVFGPATWLLSLLRLLFAVLRAVLADGWSEIEPLRGEWLDICRNAPNATPFADPDFCKLWLKHRVPSAIPRVVMLKDDQGRPQALAPLCIAPTRKSGLTIKRLRFMVAVSWLDSDFLLMHPGAGAVPDVLAAATVNCDFDMLDLFAIPCSSPSLPAIEVFGARKGYTLGYLRPPRWTNSLVSLDGTWEDYLARRSARTRYVMRRVDRKMGRCGSAEIEKSGGPDGLEGSLSTLECIVAKSWKDPSSYLRGGFWREFIELMSEKGLLSLYILRIDDRPAAFVVLLRHHKTIYWMQTAYDSDYAHLSPGTYLTTKAMRDCFQHKSLETTMDFLTTYPFLERLADSTQSRLRVRCFPKNPRGRLLSVAFRLSDGLRRRRLLRNRERGLGCVQGRARGRPDGDEWKVLGKQEEENREAAGEGLEG